VPDFQEFAFAARACEEPTDHVVTTVRMPGGRQVVGTQAIEIGRPVKGMRANSSAPNPEPKHASHLPERST
jgi:hypothetical protein